MTSQRWMFTSPGGEDEYKKSSVSREHSDAVFEAIAREKSAETENGKAVESSVGLREQTV